MSKTSGQPEGPRFRPPDFFLPRNLQGSARVRGDGAEIFLSWGGAIYGPASAEEVAAGLRTNWFEEETLFWFEGQAEWFPVAEFPTAIESGHHTLAGRRIGAAPQAAPLPAGGGDKSPRPGRRRRRHHRKDGGKSPRRGARPSSAGRQLIFGIILLAAVVTVALIFLLMQV